LLRCLRRHRLNHCAGCHHLGRRPHIAQVYSLRLNFDAPGGRRDAFESKRLAALQRVEPVRRAKVKRVSLRDSFAREAGEVRFGWRPDGVFGRYNLGRKREAYFDGR
jgi:hypothetical protein